MNNLAVRPLRRSAQLAPRPPGQDMHPGSGFLGTVREPFTGAWQRNIECRADTALAFSGVYSCVTTIADDVSKLPLYTRQLVKNVAEWRPDHWASRLFKKPNPYQTRLQFLQQYVVCKLLTGNVYVIFWRDDRNVPIGMFILDPRTVRPFITESGDVYYQISRNGSNSNLLAGVDWDDNVLLPAASILHDRMLTVFHPLLGVSPLFAAGYSAGAGFATVRNAKNFFENMSRASGVLTAPGKISKETAERMADKWKTNFTSGSIGQVAVLGDGLKWEPMTMTAADAQLIEILRWTIEDVARVFRVPLFMLGDLTKVSYKNSEQLARTYYQSTLQWHLESIEIAFDKFFDFGPSNYMEFDLDEMFRTESDTRFTAYKIALDAGIFSINEVRAKENYGPVKGGEEPRTQMQYVPLSQALEPPPPPEPKPAEDPPPEDKPADEGKPPPAEEGA